MKLLDLLERVAPNIALFPRWAKSLFVVTLLFAGTSVVVYAALHDAALETRAAAAASRDVTVDVTGNGGTARGLVRGALTSTARLRSTSATAYTTTDDGVRVSIAPQDPYLALLARGGPLTANAFSELGADELPLLDVKITNNSERVVFLTAALVDVASSVPDRTPIPTLETLEFTARAFELRNEGWGPLRSAVLRYRVGPPRLRHAFERPFPVTSRLGTIGIERTVGVEAGVRAAGVDVARLKRIESAPEWSPLGRQRRAAAGPLAPGAVVYGELEYETQTGAQRRVRVQVPVLLFEPHDVSSGGAVAAGSVYNLGLRVSGRDYRRVVGLAEALKPHDFDRFQIRVYAPRSSTHRFVVRLRYGTRELTTRPIELHLYVPRTHEEPTLNARATRAAT